MLPDYLKHVFGGEEEDRTRDLRIANAALSQLSYPPQRRRDSISYRLAYQSHRVLSGSESSTSPPATACDKRDSDYPGEDS